MTEMARKPHVRWKPNRHIQVRGNMASDKEHHYQATVAWTGNRGSGTSSYKAYGRDYEVRGDGKPTIAGSAELAFRGDETRWCPEELLVASLSACHHLWYLHLCAVAGVVVVDYVDQAEGVMIVDPHGNGHFTSVVLKPEVTVSAESDRAKAAALHDEAHKKCFVANSVNFPVTHQVTVRSEAA
jgi:organic hydroperoxide reductase OsmC/OhrA